MKNRAAHSLHAGLCVGLLVGLLSGAQIAHSDDKGHLLVADPAAEKLYVYSIPELELEAEFNEIRLVEHSGFLPLKGDRVLFVHEKETAHDHEEECEEEGEENGHDNKGEGADVILLPRQRKETFEAGLHEIQHCLQTIVLGVDLRETTTSSDQQNDEVIRNNAERAKRLILKLRDHWPAITADANIHT